MAKLKRVNPPICPYLASDVSAYGLSASLAVLSMEKPRVSSDRLTAMAAAKVGSGRPPEVPLMERPSSSPKSPTTWKPVTLTERYPPVTNPKVEMGKKVRSSASTTRLCFRQVASGQSSRSRAHRRRVDLGAGEENSFGPGDVISPVVVIFGGGGLVLSCSQQLLCSALRCQR